MRANRERVAGSIGRRERVVDERFDRLAQRGASHAKTPRDDAEGEGCVSGLVARDDLEHGLDLVVLGEATSLVGLEGRDGLADGE